MFKYVLYVTSSEKRRRRYQIRKQNFYRQHQI